MLVLSRKPGERIRIGERVVLLVLGVSRGRVRLAFEAPDDVAIFREEVWPPGCEFAPPDQEATEARYEGLR